MLRNICYTLMAGGIIASVWKMQENDRFFKPSIEPLVVMETRESSDAEQTADLLMWVSTIDKNGGLHPDDQTDLFDPYLALDFRTPDIMNQLELGMSREEVRSLLGDPIVDSQDDMLWTYNTACVMFEKNRLQGWVGIDPDRDLQAAKLRMLSWENRLNKYPERWESHHPRAKQIPAQPGIIRSRVAYKGSARTRGVFRSSLDRLQKSQYRTKISKSKLYRKPQFLNNMFPSREAKRRERESRPNRYTGRVTTYRRNS